MGLCNDLTTDGGCTAKAEAETKDGLRLCRDCAVYYAGEWVDEATARRVRWWVQENNAAAEEDLW